MNKLFPFWTHPADEQVAVWISDVYRNKGTAASTATKPTKGERPEKVDADSHSHTYTFETDFLTFSTICIQAKVKMFKTVAVCIKTKWAQTVPSSTAKS